MYLAPGYFFSTSGNRSSQEVGNAIKACESYQDWDPALEQDLLTAHKLLTTGLLDSPGSYRKTVKG
jgi:hypothetical protein